MAKSLVESIDEATEETHEEKCEQVESGEGLALRYYGKKITTVADLLENAGIDLRIWEIVKQTVNNWEVAGKIKNAGKQSLWKTGLRQIKVELKRRAPKVVQDGIRDLLAGWKPYKSSMRPRRVKDNRYLLAMYLNDAHFGKRAWKPESGDNYDLEIANNTYREGFDDLLAKSLRFAPNVSEIWLPIGNDFFHVNDWQSRTANETRVESTDDRFPKVFKVGAEFFLYAVSKLVEIAPVYLDWIPGNHDLHTSWHLATMLQYALANQKHVTVDVSLRARKYRRYGITVVGMCHGEKVKESKLPSLMISEARHLIDANVRFREWHLGHLHIARETEFRTEDSLPNMTIRRLPSLCGTDGWHDQQGFVDTYKMAEALVYSEARGPEARFVTHA